ncbi:DUF3103 family protein [Hymenobacter lutimineralis]|uniref:DUF3103 family protein n=1 Tax=Hymenobacter lutimineralis TaxID=2606448 RepID=A0A5D6UQA9_9BACT|nr:DUF3103 family protein [Hymenobacter lutimineralis]TYZ05776.1 DUF3103 family protein [Hymenobacter lutimineralis]
MALSLAKSLENASLRRELKKEALKKFDGDYDVLYAQFKDRVVDGYTVQERLVGETSIGSSNTLRHTSVDSAAQTIAKLQLAVPVHCEDWDTEQFVPLVAYIPQDFDEGITKQIKAFDSKGNVHWLDAQAEPTVPVVVVGMNERTDANGNINDRLYNPTAKRIAGKAEYMYQIKCTNISAIENWALGAPELEYYIAGSRKATAVEIVKGSYYKPKKRKDIDNKWVNLDRFIFTWNRPDYDDYIAVKWVEIDDTGALKPLTIKWTSKIKLDDKVEIGPELSYDFSKLDRFDDAGTMTVWQGESFGDGGVVYDTGYMAFKLDSK